MQTKKFLDSDGLSYFYSLLNNTFIKNESISDWAKQPTKPIYTANEVGALSTSTHYAGSTSVAGPADKAVSIPFAQVASTSTSKVFTATVPGITELRDGVCVFLRNGVVNSTSGFTLNINNLGAKPVYSNQANSTRETTLFSSAYTMLFIYNSTRVDGGCWDLYRGYNSDNYFDQALYHSRLTLSSNVYRYRLLFTSQNGTNWVPANNSSSTNATASRTTIQEKINPFGPIVYYNATTAISAKSSPADLTLRSQMNAITLGYSFNRTGDALTLTANAPVFIKCAPQSDGSAIIEAETPYTQTLPSTEDGKIYIFLGIANSATAVELHPVHPVYYYKSGGIKLWTGINQDGSYYSN